MKISSAWPMVMASLALGTAAPVSAQLAAPGPSGVAMGHVHLLARDLDAQRRFWTLLGGVAVKNGTLEMIRFPGVFILLRQGEPTGGSIGSSVNHFGFTVKNVAETLARWRAGGVIVESQVRPTQAYISGPGDVRIEVLEDAAQDVPIRFHHVHFMTVDQLATQAWYAKVFGAVPGKRAQFDAADLPGVNLTFSHEDMPAPSRGRAIDHVGFEVKGLEAFAKKLEGMGIRLDQAPQKAAASPATTVAFLTDPWGTRIELTENLSPP